MPIFRETRTIGPLHMKLWARSFYEVVDREWSETGQNESGQTCEREEIALVARWAELRTSVCHGDQFDRAETVGQVYHYPILQIIA